ncbi:MAG: hypothetical protein R3F55_06965 [Alphaproteobacteria bacterium]
MALVAACLAQAPGAAAEPEADCRQNADLSAKLGGCTALLGVLDGIVLDGQAWAYAERANAACWAGQPDHAVRDIWAWFDADPASIRRMQAKLSALGLFAGEADGGFSAALDDAVIAWAGAGCPEAP